MKSNVLENSDDVIQKSPDIRATLRVLLEAHELAAKAQRPVEDLALKFPSLLQQGATVQALHWLLSKNFISRVSARSRTRGRQLSDAMIFTERTSFVLTEIGAARARMSPSFQPTDAPHWDGRCELSFVGRTVKFFRAPAESQTTILAAFEKHHWIRFIENPLPWHSQDDPPKSLRNAVQRLNGSQITKLLAFHVTHCGTCVSWDDLRSWQDAAANGRTLARQPSAVEAQSERSQGAG